MYVITGASGNTGGVAARTLLEQGKEVRVIGRNPDHLRQFVDRGAEAVAADLADTDKITRAFAGAEGVYALIPPDPRAPDIYAYDEKVTTSLASAISQAKVKNVVSLSSIGADKSSGTGPVLGLFRQEQAFSRLDGVNVLHLRAGYFMENTLAQADVIHKMGITAGPLLGDLKMPMIATRDIGAAAAQALLRLDFKGHQTRELLGPRDISYNEVTSIIGKAIGRPDLNYTRLSGEQLRPVFQGMGMSPNFVNLLLEMCAALESGHMRALEPRTPQNSTPTTYEQFVAEKFLPLFQATSKAA